MSEEAQGGPATIRRGYLLTWVAFLIFAWPTLVMAQQELIVGTVDGQPGETVQIPVSYQGAGLVAGLQFDLSFDATTLTAGAVTPGGGLINHLVDHAVPEVGLLRILVHSSTNDELSTGEILAVTFHISGDAALGFSVLTPSGVTLGDATGAAILPTQVESGGIDIVDCSAPDHLELTEETIDFAVEYEACLSITAGPEFRVVAPGDVTLRAPQVVVTGPFAIEEGAVLVIGDLVSADEP